MSDPPTSQERKTKQAAKTLPTSTKEKGPPRAKAPCDPSKMPWYSSIHNDGRRHDFNKTVIAMRHQLNPILSSHYNQTSMEGTRSKHVHWHMASNT